MQGLQRVLTLVHNRQKLLNFFAQRQQVEDARDKPLQGEDLCMDLQEAPWWVLNHEWVVRAHLVVLV